MGKIIDYGMGSPGIQFNACNKPNGKPDIGRPGNLWTFVYLGHTEHSLSRSRNFGPNALTTGRPFSTKPGAASTWKPFSMGRGRYSSWNDVTWDYNSKKNNWPDIVNYAHQLFDEYVLVNAKHPTVAQVNAEH